MIHHPTI